MQAALLLDHGKRMAPPAGQLLKWIGNKQRYAAEISSYFPSYFGRYFEPFLGSGAVLATLGPERAEASDTFGPLMEIWEKLKADPAGLKHWYGERWALSDALGKQAGYDLVKESYNARPNGADLLFLCRACYGGVVRFRKSDGFMSTPVGAHKAMPPASFARRVDDWSTRIQGARLSCRSYEQALDTATANDLVYCDPPYSHSQAILYGAQGFNLEDLLDRIANCKKRGVLVALSIDGSKKTGDMELALPIPKGLFEREVVVDCGRSMLRRFQMHGKTLETEVVTDRLLLTY